MNLALNYWFSQCYNTRILTAKLSPYYFAYLLIQLTVYNRTITRFIADDNVVYQWVRRDIRLVSDNSWARHHLKHVSWRSRWIIFLYTLEQREWQFHAKSNELTDAFLACPPDWARGFSLLRDKRGLTLPGSGTIVPVLWILFSRLSMLQSFQPLSGNSLNSLRAPHCFDR